jgi:predicted ABC-type ATPase
MSEPQKKVVIIAGPNGAGKTTFARAFLPLSGLAYARRIGLWRSEGYAMKLMFLKLSSVDEALARVAMRVRQGGHDVPAHIVRRRFHAGWRQFEDI